MEKTSQKKVRKERRTLPIKTKWSEVLANKCGWAIALKSADQQIICTPVPTATIREIAKAAHILGLTAHIQLSPMKKG